MNSSPRFPYTLVRDARGDEAHRPLLSVALSYGERTINEVALLDTGADVNVLPYQMGIRLGANWAEQTRSLDLSGNLGRYEARAIVLNASVHDFVPVDLIFAWTKVENAPFILGQVNFFMEFDVCFFRSQLAFEVRPKAEA